jgi:cell division protein FtsI (penicillin-binding protein 3)
MANVKLSFLPSPSKRRSSRAKRSERSAKVRSRRQTVSDRQQKLKNSRQETKKNQGITSRNLTVRLIIVWMILIAGTVGLALNLYRLQILEGSELTEKARDQQMVYMRPYIPRRSIVDRQDNVLATDKLVYSLFVHPKLFKISKQEMAETLAKILPDKTPEDLEKIFNRRDTGIRVYYSLPEPIADQVSKLRLDGLELIQHYGRFYPQKELLAGILGYVDMDHRGQAGLEFSQQQSLERNIRTVRLSRAGNGALLPTNLPEGLLNYDDLQLQLTLDLRIQRATRQALTEQMKKFKAKRGTVIVLDVHDGSIVSLVSEPTFDPNRYYESDIKLFKNWAISDLYEPGSTFKPIIVAVALDSGVIQPNSVVHDPGTVVIDGWPISNFDKRGNGSINIATVIERSSNVGMIRIIQKMKALDYYNALKELGLGEPMGVDLPGETAGNLRSEKSFTGALVARATTSFGQGINLTPLKLAQLTAAIANGGKLVTPHLVTGLVDSQGEFHWKPKYETKQVFKPESSEAVLKMMEQVVSRGTGKTAAIEGYRIGGKTGTAQKVRPGGAGYMSGAKITSFIGILPTDAPRYVVLAVIDEPQGGNTFGSTVAAPIVKKVMEAIIGIDNIPPSK